MIKLTDPKHGWITLHIANGKGVIEIDFSDVGPDTIGQLQFAIAELRAGKDGCEVLFNLEPEYVTLSISGSKNQSILEVSVDGNHAQSIEFDRATFINELDLELCRVLPLCVDPNWTNSG